MLYTTFPLYRVGFLSDIVGQIKGSGGNRVISRLKITVRWWLRARWKRNRKMDIGKSKSFNIFQFLGFWCPMTEFRVFGPENCETRF